MCSGGPATPPSGLQSAGTTDSLEVTPRRQERETNRRTVRHGEQLSRRAGGAHQCAQRRGHPRPSSSRPARCTRQDTPHYSVIVDRISHDIPFYRAFLKHAALNGTIIVNNPFWWSADDKFFNYTLAAKLGVAVPPTVILPHKQHPEGTTDRSMRNLEYPLDWDSAFSPTWASTDS